jgi:hypothetical protein
MGIKSQDLTVRQKSVESLHRILDHSPISIELYMGDIWADLSHVAGTPAELALASQLFRIFSVELSDQASDFISTCWKLLADQALIEPVTHLLSTIAQRGDRRHILNDFALATRNKDGNVKKCAMKCIDLASANGELEDQEFDLVVECCARLIRDKSANDIATGTIERIADDERFDSAAKRVVKNQNDLRELMNVKDGKEQ